MFRWSMTGSLRKCMIIWGYFWFLGVNGQKPLKIVMFWGFLYLINNSKLYFFRKPLLYHLDFNCSKSIFVSIFIIYILLAWVIFFNSILLPDQCELGIRKEATEAVHCLDRWKKTKTAENRSSSFQLNLHIGPLNLKIHRGSEWPL